MGSLTGADRWLFNQVIIRYEQKSGKILSKNILILYWSKNGATKNLARAVARGVDSVDGAEATLRVAADDSDGDAPVVELDDLRGCDGLIIGSPAYFGNMAAPLKAVFDNSTPLWLNGALCGKPGGVFTSVGSLHGGHESTLLSMMLPLIHHGMLICSVPCTEAALEKTTSGGTPYGASHHTGVRQVTEINEDESAICFALGRRVAETAISLS